MTDRGSRKKIQNEDEEIEQQIREDIQRIRQKDNLNEVEKIQQIDNLYRKKKQQKKYKKMMQKGQSMKKSNYNYLGNRKNSIESQSEQPGQINNVDQYKSRQLSHHHNNHNNNQPHISINQLGQLIRQITLTRKRIIDLMNSRKFQILIKGCFVRYLSDSNIKKNDNYIIAQIIGLGEGKREYQLAQNQKTKLVLKLQQTSEKIIELPITMVSNQSKKEGNLEINQWLNTNRQKAPKQKQLRDKLQQHNRLLTQQLSSQQIDKNIQNRARAISKGQQQPKQDIQNLIDFITQKIDNYQALQQQQISKRKQDPIQLMQIRRQKQQYQKIKKILEEKKKRFFQEKGIKNNANNNKMNQQGYKDNVNNNNKDRKVMIKIEEKRQDQIRQKWKLKEMLLCTAEGYQKIRNNLIQNHNKYDIQLVLDQ